jgi:Helix-turn-helix domain
MSHRAVNWALERRELKPAPWILLIKLADRHNKDTKQVNPDQFRLAADCNMSRATVNRHLNDLEAMGLLYRVQRVHPVSRKQLSTYYVLGLDFDAPPVIEHAVSQNETRGEAGQTENIDASRVSNCDSVSVSQKSANPCLKNADFRVSNCDTNQVKEPVKEPPCAARTVAAVGFDDFWKVYPKPRNEAQSRQLFDEAVSDGADPEILVNAAKAYAGSVADTDRKYISGSNSWLERGRWSEISAADLAAAGAARPASKFSDPAEFYADWVKRAVAEKKRIPPSAIGANMAREMLGRGLVSRDELKAVGVMF